MAPERLEELAHLARHQWSYRDDERDEVAVALREYARVVRVFADGYPYMERNEDGYVAGDTLRACFSDHHPTPLAAILDLADRLGDPA